MNNCGSKIIVQEVGLRDGLQSLSQIMATDDKKRWIDAVYAAGVRYLFIAMAPARLNCVTAEENAMVQNGAFGKW